MLETYQGFHGRIKSQLDAAQYAHWKISVSDLTDSNEFLIIITGKEVIFDFDIAAGVAGSYLGLVTAFIGDDYSNVIASFSFDSRGICKEITSLEDPANLQDNLNCLNIALNICLKSFKDLEPI